MICIYHRKDLDGYCSGAIVKRKFPDCQLVGYDYGDDWPLTDEQMKNQDLIMIDVSVPISKMVSIAVNTHHLTWIDHHISAINEFNEFLYYSLALQTKVTAVLKVGVAACELAWEYFFPTLPMPAAVKLLGEYDTWRNENKEHWDRLIMPFQYGMRLNCNSPETFLEDLLEDVVDIEYIANEGRTVLRYQQQQDKRACSIAFPVDFEGYRAICLNAGGGNSQMFDTVYDEEKYDLMILFVYTGRHWKFSLYTTKDIDCSAIAKRYGGGGHKKAAGFELPELPKNFKK